MGIIAKLRRVVGNETESATHTYECQACNHRFESSTQVMTDVTCPNCGDHNVRDAKMM